MSGLVMVIMPRHLRLLRLLTQRRALDLDTVGSTDTTIRLDRAGTGEQDIGHGHPTGELIGLDRDTPGIDTTADIGDTGNLR
jgi:hypothetical protein